MTGFNDPVLYNAPILYDGLDLRVTSETTVGAVASLTLTAIPKVQASASTDVPASASLSVGRTVAAAASSTSVAATASLGRTAHAGAAAETTTTATATLGKQRPVGAVASIVVDAAARLTHAGSMSATASTTVRAVAVLTLTKARIVVSIDGEPVMIRADTLEVDFDLGQRSTARMTVIDDDGTARFARGARVAVTVGDTLAWSGYVDSDEWVRLGADPGFLHSLTCVDQQYLADKRIAAATFNPGATCGDVVRALYSDYLAAEGVTLGAVEDGATLEQGMLVNYQPVSDALGALVDASDGYVWTIDAARELTFRHRSSVTAPWNVNTMNVMRNPTPTVTVGNPDFRNVQWILGGLATTDPQTETRVGDGDTQAWPMSYPLAMVPTVLLNGAAQRVGIKGLEDDSTYDFGWNKGDPVISQSSGGAKLTASDTLTVTYQGQYAIVARVDDPSGIADAAEVEGGSGIVEQATSPGNINSADQAFALGQARLDTYDQPGVKLGFDTYRQGLAAGQWVTVDLPGLGLDSVQMLIESVHGVDAGGGRLRWSVTAVDGPTTMPWQKVLGAAPELRKDDLVSVGSGTVVALVVSPRDTTGWSEAVEENPMVCNLLPYTLPTVLC